MLFSTRLPTICALLLVPTLGLASCDSADEPVSRVGQGDDSILPGEASEPVEPSDAELAAGLDALEPIRTRNNALRFVSPLLHESGAGAGLLHRYQTGGEDAEHRAALIEAMSRTPDFPAAAVAGAFVQESDASVRSAMAYAFRRGDVAAVEGLTLALADEDPAVAAAAATAWRSRPDADPLESMVRDLLGRDEQTLVVAAASALGARGDQTTVDPLLPLLIDARAEVRLAGLRAIGRLDAERLARLPQTMALTGDSDDRVAGRAQRALGLEP